MGKLGTAPVGRAVTQPVDPRLPDSRSKRASDDGAPGPHLTIRKVVEVRVRMAASCSN
jgi:hypothetical protein